MCGPSIPRVYEQWVPLNRYRSAKLPGRRAGKSSSLEDTLRSAEAHQRESLIWQAACMTFSEIQDYRFCESLPIVDDLAEMLLPLSLLCCYKWSLSHMPVGDLSKRLGLLKILALLLHSVFSTLFRVSSLWWCISPGNKMTNGISRNVSENKQQTVKVGFLWETQRRRSIQLELGCLKFCPYHPRSESGTDISCNIKIYGYRYGESTSCS